jgi:hypothetical protein
MTISNADLLALFPSTYSRRTAGGEADRDWFYLRLPKMRAFGPFWSFTLIAAGRGGATRNLAVDVMTEAGDTIPVGPDTSEKLDLHEPLLIRADIADLWSSDETGAENFASRWSLIAVDTLTTDPQFPLPNINGRPSGFDPKRSSSVVLAPFGRIPKNRSSKLHLPAMRLVSGEIWFRPQEDYLPRLREVLKLAPPESSDPEAGLMALLPDGVAFKAKVPLPWRPEGAEKFLVAWIKLTERQTGEEIAPVLRLWTGRDPAMDVVWNDALEEIAEILGDADARDEKPHWLTFTATRKLTPELLFWPLARRAEVLVHRGDPSGQDDRLAVEGQGLLAQFSSDDGAPIAIRPDVFEIARHRDGGVAIRARQGTSEPGQAKPGAASATYTYAPDAEELALSSGGGSELTLALPLMLNAGRLREKMGFDEPRRAMSAEPSTKCDDARDARGANGHAARLWLYTPLQNGWLHWPFPNATNEFLTLVKPDPEEAAARESEDLPSVDSTPLTSGLWRMRNRDGAAERAWSLSLSDALAVDLSIHVSRDKNWRILRAGIELVGLSIRFDKLLPITVFSQRPNRLLPEAAERALRADGLDAVTPDLLVGQDARMWSGRDTQRLMWAAAEIRQDADGARPMVIRPSSDGRSVRFANGMSLDISVHWPTAADDKQDLFQARGYADDLPWLWLAHGSLATAQTLPLAAAAEATNEPSGNRQLAPLRMMSADAGKMTDLALRFKDPFEMTRSGLVFDPGANFFERPGRDLAWENEVGQAVVTLPSVTLYPGIGTRRSHEISDGNGIGHWADTPLLGRFKLGLVADIRYDISIADESFALASLPPPEPTEDNLLSDPGPRAVVFQPDPWNAPGPDDPSGSFFSVWVDRSIQLALSATHDRRMVSVRKNNVQVLSNLFGETDYPLQKVELDTEASILSVDAEYGGDMLQFDRGGRLRLEFSADLGMPPVVLDGLPSTTDLMGITGSYPRDDGEAGEVALGTLNAIAEVGGLWDQSGWAFEFQATPDVNHAVRLRDAGRFSTVSARGKWKRSRLDRLVLGTMTTPEPVQTFSNGPGYRSPEFYFRDVPFDEFGRGLEADLSDAWATEHGGWDAASGGLGPDRNIRHGFAWSLTQDRVPGHLVFGPFAVEPLALIAVKLQPDRRVTYAELKGRVKLAVPDGNGIGFIEGRGDATIYLSRTSDGLVATCAIDGLEQPLILPGSVDRIPPTYCADHLSLGAQTEASGERLRFTFGESLLEVPVAADMQADEVSQQVIAVPAPDAGLVFSNADVRLPPVIFASPYGGPSISSPSASVALAADFGDPEGRYTLREYVDLIAATHVRHRGQSKLSIAGKDLPLDVTFCAVEDTDVLNGQSIGLQWSLKVGDEGFPFFGDLRAMGTSAGAALIVLGALQDDLDRFAIAGLEHCASLDLRLQDKAEMRLDYPVARGDVPGAVQFSGRLSTTNLLPFHDLAVTNDGAYLSATLSSNTGRIEHAVEAKVSGARATLSDLANGQLSLASAVKHSLIRDGAGTAIGWSAHQIVTLFDNAGLTAALEALLGSSAVSVLTHDAEKLPEHTVGTHLVRPHMALPFGLNTTQAEGLLRWLNDTRKPLSVIDASGHHFLTTASPDGQAPTCHLPLPALGVLDPANTPDPFENLGSVQADVSLRRRSGPGEGIELAPLDNAAVAQIEERRNALGKVARADGVGLATALWRGRVDRHPRNVFQGRAEAKTTNGWAWSDPLPHLGSADVSLRLSHWLSSQGPVVSGYVLAPGGWRNEQFVGKGLVDPDTQSTILTKEAYDIAWGLLGNPAEHLVPGPAADGSGHVGCLLVLRAANRDKTRIEEIGRLTVPFADLFGTDVGGRPAGAAKVRDWARDVLARDARWAVSALVVVFRVADWVPETFLSMAVSADGARGVRPRVPTPPRRSEAIAQHQRLTHPPISATLPDGIAEGYLPFLSGSEVVKDAPGTLLGGGQTEVALTATGAVTGFALGATQQRVLADRAPNGHQGFWISDRDVVVPRPFEAVDFVDRGVHAEITFALPPDHETALPAAFAPAASGGLYPLGPPGQDAPKGTAFVVPPVQIQSQITMRSGAWTTRRLGIDMVRQKEDEPLEVLPSPQLPLTLRSPRPVELGVNDRPRASAFEAKHLSLTRNPQAILHDKGAGAEGVDIDDTVVAEGSAYPFAELAPKAGLDRRPRSKGAIVVEMTKPGYGLLGPDWDGSFHLESVMELGAKPPAWTASEAIVDVAGTLYKGVAEDAGVASFGDDPFRLVGFRRLVGTQASGPPLLTDLANLPSATPLSLRLLLQSEGLERQLVFALYKTGGDAPLVETPAFLRFDDPAYNDRLTGQPELDRVPVPGATNCDLVLLGERKEVTPSDYVVLAVALVPRNADNGLGANLATTADGTVQIELNGGTVVPLKVTAERRRPGTTATVALHPTVPNQIRSETFATLGQRLYLFHPVQDDGEPPLLADDRVTMSVRLELGDLKEAAQLRLDVVDRLRFAGNPAAYGLNRLNWSVGENTEIVDPVLSLPLYSRFAEPAVIELVDPVEMQRGIVRRRAHYYWRDFAQTSGDGQRRRFALLKSARTGAAWLPADIEQDWQELPEMRR